jgi:hypothetical protein
MKINGWINKMSNRKGQIIYVVISFFCGAFLLCVFSTIQKKSIGTPLVVKGYIVPFVFGGLSWAIIGFYIGLIKKYNHLMKERLNRLESILPICSNCKKIRKPESDYKEQDSWIPVETYISTKTSSSFTHSICPECMKKLYGDILYDDD